MQSLTDSTKRHVHSFCAAPKGSWIGRGTGDFETHQPAQIVLWEYPRNQFKIIGHFPSSVAITTLCVPSDSKFIVGGCRCWRFYRHSRSQSILHHRFSLEGQGNTLAFSPDGTYIVASYLNNRQQGTLKIWDAHSCTLLLTHNLKSGTINNVTQTAALLGSTFGMATDKGLKSVSIARCQSRSTVCREPPFSPEPTFSDASTVSGGGLTIASGYLTAVTGGVGNKASGILPSSVVDVAFLHLANHKVQTFLS